MGAIEHILIKAYDKLDEIARINDPSKLFKPVYDYGTKKDLDRFILDKHKQKVSFYPVVWCLTPVITEGRRPSGEVNLILGILNSDHNMSNRQRNEQTVIYLETLYKDLILKTDLCRSVKRIKRSNERKSTYYNISVNPKEGEESFTIDNWDAIKVTLTLELTGCEC